MEIFVPINVKNANRIFLRFLITQIASYQKIARLQHTQILLCFNVLIAQRKYLHYQSMTNALIPKIALQDLLGAKSYSNAADVMKTHLLIRIELFAHPMITVQMGHMRTSPCMTVCNA